MKLSCLFILFFTLAMATSLHAQGPLTPPGPPAPGMKSLDQIYANVDEAKDARIPLMEGSPGVMTGENGGFTISEPGSYYLTQNLDVTTGDAVQLNANGITFDLNGYTISSTSPSPSGSAVRVQGSRIKVANGHIVSQTLYAPSDFGNQFTGSGFYYGIYSSASDGSNVHVHSVTVKGCRSSGIYFSHIESAVVESCSVQTSSSVGIRAGTIKNCYARETMLAAINGLIIENCRGKSIRGDGIRGETVVNSYGHSDGFHSSSHGIQAITVQNSVGFATHQTGGSGISATNVSNSHGESASTSSGSHGISARSVSGSRGIAEGGNGISASLVTNSSGYAEATGRHGIKGNVVSYCQGETRNTAAYTYGIKAVRAIGCYALGGESITNKYLMP